MEAVELIAIIVLIIAIAVLIYYYLINHPATAHKIRTIVPEGVDAPIERVLYNNKSDNDVGVDMGEDDSMSNKIKIKLTDIDFNTEGFSKKIDAFLDEKSDQLIKDWSLATTKDLSTLEDRFNKTVQSVDELEKRFANYESKTDERFESIEKRIDALEEN